MTMNRRNVLVGLGAAAVGTGAAFGSGAFTQIEADREVNVEVAEDSDAQVGLDANDDVDGVENTELSIDLDSVNEESTLWLGTYDESGTAVPTPAFTVENNTDGSYAGGDGTAVPITVSADVSDIGAGDDAISLYAEDPSGNIQNLHDGDSVELSDETESAAVAVEIFVDGDGFDGGSITFTAEENSS